MDEMTRRDLKAILEALLLVSDKPLTIIQVRNVLEELKPTEIQELFEELISDYKNRDSGIEILEIAGGFQFRTRAEMATWIRKFHKTKPLRLSRPALETLAVIAYKQPVTRAELESIRGVDCGGVGEWRSPCCTGAGRR